MQLSVVIPLYNEAEQIARTIERLERALRALHGMLVVWDFDEDNTVPIVCDLIRSNHRLHLVKNN